MKTAVSIPDDIFAEADRLAHCQKKSRSQLYADALREYIMRHDPDEITESWNRLHDDPEAKDPELDAFVQAWARRTLERTEW